MICEVFSNILICLRELVLVHLDRNVDKFNLLMYVPLITPFYSRGTPNTNYSVCVCVLRFMARKLYAFAGGECMGESPDSPMHQEILLGGHFYLMVLKVCSGRSIVFHCMPF